MDARLAVIKRERFLDAQMDAADMEAARSEENVDSQTRENWFQAANDPAYLGKLLWDYSADPVSELEEIWREFARVSKKDFGSIDFAAFGLQTARIIQKRMEDIASSMCEQRG